MRPKMIKLTYYLNLGTVEVVTDGKGRPEEVLITLTGGSPLALPAVDVERLGQVVAKVRERSGDYRQVCAEHGYYESGRCAPCHGEAEHLKPPKPETLRALTEASSGDLTTTTEMPS